MVSNFKPIGDFIRRVDKRNRDLSVTDLRGLSMTKEFRKTTSNIIGTDMSNYKVLNKNQFACDFMSVIRVYKLPVVLHTEEEPIIVSPAYPVFEVIDENVLLPEYLMMWMRRSEFDRYAFFRCDSAIRGGFGWEELCEVEIPIPDIDTQKEIVKEYNIIINRIELNNQLIQKLEETAQTIYKQWFVDFEFHDENGNPYKSSGGEMEYNEELDMEIPKGWELKKLHTLSEPILGGTPSRFNDSYWGGDISWINSGEVNKIRITKETEKITKSGLSKSSTKLMPKKTTVLAITGATLGQVSILEIEACANQSVIGIIQNEKFPYEFIFPTINHLIQELLKNQTGGAQPHINKDDVKFLDVIYPKENILLKFKNMICPLYSLISEKCFENDYLTETKDLILKKMSKIPVEVVAK